MCICSAYCIHTADFLSFHLNFEQRAGKSSFSGQIDFSALACDRMDFYAVVIVVIFSLFFSFFSEELIEKGMEGKICATICMKFGCYY